jgi:hypothetical protein
MVEYFAEAVQAARAIPGLREISLALDEAPGDGRRLLESLGPVVVAAGFHLSAQIAAGQVGDWDHSSFTPCREVALRFDMAEFSDLGPESEFYDRVSRLQAESLVVGFHVVLVRRALGLLTLSQLRRFLQQADFVTLKAPRGSAPDFEPADLIPLFERLVPLWEQADRFFHLNVDRCIKPAFTPWNQLFVTCPAADLALHLGRDGRLFLCSSERPFAVLARPGDLPSAVAGHLKSREAGAAWCDELASPSDRRGNSF